MDPLDHNCGFYINNFNLLHGQIFINISMIFNNTIYYLYLDQQILGELEKAKILAYTPSRQVGGRRVVCHDDRYILNLASETGAIVVSNDNFREFISEKPEYKKVISERILMYSFVNDR